MFIGNKRDPYIPSQGHRKLLVCLCLLGQIVAVSVISVIELTPSVRIACSRGTIGGLMLTQYKLSRLF